MMSTRTPAPALAHPARSALSAAALLAALVAVPLSGGAQAVTAPAPASTGAVRYDLVDEVFHPVHTTHGMVASESYLASQVGLKVLKDGGNAVDAAVATGFAMAVTYPRAGNIGGGGYMVIHLAQ